MILISIILRLQHILLSLLYMHNHKLARVNKLKGVVATQQLFSNPLIKKNYPLKMYYTLNSSKVSNTKFGVSAPKKLFKKAVDRNFIKRILRECIRKNKHLIEDSYNLIDKTMIIYISSSLPEYHEIEQKIITLLTELNLENKSHQIIK